VLEPLGVGGQGTAYLAVDELGVDQDQGVVLKEFILPTHVNQVVHLQALEKFNREAAVLENLDHPGIVQIKNYFVEDHRGYLALERIDGQSLRAMAESGKTLPLETASDVLRQICDILSYLHSRTPPVVHRDLTPDNLILSNNGKIKLIDFNVAHNKGQGASTATVVGKHAYLPPEQFRGQPTTRSDLYALGGTLFFMLTGHDPEPLSQSSLPPGSKDDRQSALIDKLNQVIRKCTELDENDRFEAAAQIIEALDTADVTSTFNGSDLDLDLDLDLDSDLDSSLDSDLDSDRDSRNLECSRRQSEDHANVIELNARRRVQEV